MSLTNASPFSLLTVFKLGALLISLSNTRGGGSELKWLAEPLQGHRSLDAMGNRREQGPGPVSQLGGDHETCPREQDPDGVHACV